MGRKPLYLAFIVLLLTGNALSLGLNVEKSLGEGTHTLNISSRNNWFKVNQTATQERINLTFTEECGQLEPLEVLIVQETKKEFKTIGIAGTGYPSDYSFTVTGTVEGSFGITGEDKISGNNVNGAVRAGLDVYKYTGELNGFTATGNVSKTVYKPGLEINQKTVNPCKEPIAYGPEKKSELYFNVFSSEIDTTVIKIEASENLTQEEKIDGQVNDSKPKKEETNTVNVSNTSAESDTATENETATDDSESDGFDFGLNLVPLALFLSITGLYGYRNDFKDWIIYEGEGPNIRSVLRNLHLGLAGLMLILVSLVGPEGEPGYFYFWTLFLMLLTVYWTPPIQKLLYDKLRNNLLLYFLTIFFMPVGVPALAYRAWNTHKNRRKLVKGLRNEQEKLIQKIENLELPENRENERKRLIQSVEKLEETESYSETKELHEELQNNISDLEKAAEEHKERKDYLKQQFKEAKKDAEELKEAGYLSCDSEIMELSEPVENEDNIVEFRDRVNSLQSEVDRLKKGEIQSYVQNFVEKHGRGNERQIKMLKKSIQRQEDLCLSTEFIEEQVKIVASNNERNALKTLLKLHEPEDYEDYLEAFVKEFGEGNKILLSYLSDMLGRPEQNIEQDVNETFERVREQKELEQFEENLGIAEADTSEGSEISKLSQEERELLESLEGEKSINELNDLDGLEFEYFLSNLFEEMGYKTEVTTGSNDQGADVVARKPHETVVIQAKHHNANVGNSAVQEVNTAFDVYDADRAIVVSTSDFTSSAREAASATDVELWNRQRLQTKIEQYMDKSNI